MSPMVKGERWRWAIVTDPWNEKSAAADIYSFLQAELTTACFEGAILDLIFGAEAVSVGRSARPRCNRLLLKPLSSGVA